MMLKALPLVHFWSVLLLKEQVMTSVRKTLKTLVWSAHNRSISSEICPENNHKIRRFFTDFFPAKFAPKIPAKSVNFSRFCPYKSSNLTLFSATYQKPWLWNCNLIIKSIIIYRSWNLSGKKWNKEKTLLHLSLKLLEILYITWRFCKVIPEADRSWPLTGSESKGRHV